MTCKHSFDEIELGWANGLCAYCLMYALAEARKDAERYRFIRYHSPTYFVDHWNAPINPSLEQQDAAIDAAMKDQTK